MNRRLWRPLAGSTTNWLDQRAVFDGGSLAVTVPEHQAAAWANGDAVGMEEVSGGVRLLIEKDWACVAPRADEDESDMFENPEASTAC